MTLDFWTKTSGTWINVATVLLGTTLGLLLKGRLPQVMQQVITQGVGLITLYVGFNMADSLGKVRAGRIEGVILGLLAIALGGVVGEWLRLEDRLAAIGDWLKVRVRGTGSFTEGFVAASLLFCVGPITLLGSLNNGLTGDNTLLTLKATMDGLASLALSSSFGIGVGFSTLVMLPYQAGLSLMAGVLAQLLSDPANNPYVLLITGVGGLMILGIGLNLLDIKRLRIASFLPALFLVPLFYAIAISIP